MSPASIVFMITEVCPNQHPISIKPVYSSSLLVDCFKAWLDRGYSEQPRPDGAYHVMEIFINDLPAVKVTPDKNYFIAAIESYERQEVAA